MQILCYTRKGASLTGYSTTKNYEGVVKELVHLDTHGAQPIQVQIVKIQEYQIL